MQVLVYQLPVKRKKVSVSASEIGVELNAGQKGESACLKTLRIRVYWTIVSELRQQFYVDIDRYAAAVYKPDPDKVRRFITDFNFYDASDAIIAAARGIQRGEGVTALQVERAAKAEARSQYAKALKMGYGYLCAASDFFAGSLSIYCIPYL